MLTWVSDTIKDAWLKEMCFYYKQAEQNILYL